MNVNQALVWPVPALLAWGTAWALFAVLQRSPAAGFVAVVLATGWGAGLSLLGTTWWRRAIIALGFPLSLLASGLITLPAWAWLLPLALCLLVYPLNAWRDAPLFPTPRDALAGLASAAPLAPGAAVLDGGCGLGHGLQALRQAYPAAQLHGVEWSWPLRIVCALRCPWARVRQGDLWRSDWSTYRLVYLFQRPESMERAAAKALAELLPGAWLASLEFEVAELKPQAVLQASDGRPLWLYQAPLERMGAAARVAITARRSSPDS